MSPGIAVAMLAWLAVMLIMAGEAVLSAHNEAVLRARGAIEPPDDVYRTMRWAYPGCFAAMAIEGGLTGPAPPNVLICGLVVFGLAKALKTSAIAALGIHWTFRVLVLPGQPLVAAGPYRVLRHPNYVAIVGEMAGMALIVWAPLMGLVSLAGFGWLMWKRIRVEDRALGRQ